MAKNFILLWCVLSLVCCKPNSVHTPAGPELVQSEIPTKDVTVPDTVNDTVSDTVKNEGVTEEISEGVKDTPVIVELQNSGPVPVKIVEVPKKNVRDSVVRIYSSQVGVREKTGKNDGTEVEKYLRSVNLGKGNPWCAAFVHWCFLEAGVKTPITAWSPTTHNPKNLVYFQSKVLQEPLQADVFSLYYPNLKRIGHTGFYDGWANKKAGTFKTVEGNTNDANSREGDGVYRRIRKLSGTYSISRWLKD